MTDQRPTPEQMLARLRNEEPRAAAGEHKRGRLKIFFGYAAGVGKTYTMLEMARAQAAEGATVLLGLVETHGRAETEALLDGLDVLPRTPAAYGGATLRELDLDAALARKPSLCVVDELAHTNPPNMRHAKRWQDVQELLDAGIDVYTTVNVQHIESLNDVVAQISGVRMAETMPDRVFDEAGEVEIVDLPPDELLDRFQQGKVYVPEQAERAMQNFFRKPNLIALREIALRKAADRVNVDVQTARIGQATLRSWPTRERLLVCVGPSPSSAKVIRSARRLAAALNAEWVAVAVEQPAPRRAGRDDGQRLAQNLQLAESLGAETAVLSGQDVAAEVLSYAAEKNVTKIVIGKTDQKRRWWNRFGTVVDELLTRSGDIDVYVVRGLGDLLRAARTAPASKTQRPVRWLYAAGVMLLSAGAALGLQASGLSEANIVMTFLLGVAVVAFRLGIGPAVVASIAGVLLFNFLFTTPHYTLVVNDPGYLYTFAIMLAIGLAISTLAHRVRRQAHAARRTQRRTESLYQLSRHLVGAAGLADAVMAGQQRVGEAFDAEVLVLLPDGSNRVGVRFGPAPPYIRRPHEAAAAQWVFEHTQSAGPGTDTLPTTAALYVPLVSRHGPVGVLAVRPRRPAELLRTDQRQLLETFAAQVAMAIHRERLTDESRRGQIEVETERLRSNLLSSVSHDLRTPLAAIAGASSSLLDDSAKLDEPTRRDLTRSIHDESTRLSRLVENLLHMTRLESGATKVVKDWQPLDEIIGSAVTRVRQYARAADLLTDVPADLPLVPVDGVLLEQVLINLLENAMSHGAAGGIEVRARAQPAAVAVEVLDRGPGIPAGQERRIFEKFARAASPESSGSGAGLGLAICDAIVRAHGGTIEASNRPGAGACLRFTIPLAGTPPSVDDPGDEERGPAAGDEREY